MGSEPTAPEPGAAVALRRLLERGIDWIGPLGVAAAAYMAVRFAVEVAAALHAGAALLVAVVAIGLSYAMCNALDRRFLRKMPVRAVLGAFGVVLLTSISAFAAVSYFLWSKSWGAYDVRPDATIGTFADAYVYQFGEMLPLDLWKTLGGVPSPATPKDALAGAPFVAFRVMLIVVFFAQFLAWRDERRKSRERALRHQRQ